MKNRFFQILALSLLTFSLNSLASGPAADHAADHGSEGKHPDKATKMANVLRQPVSDPLLSQIPQAPTLVSPVAYSQVSTESVTLKWNPSEGANEYHLQVASDVNFKWLIQDQPFVVGTEATLNLSKGKNYFWRVAAVKSDNKTTHRKSNFSNSTFEIAP
ncbi:MAG TPA: fibronectin type III domain-containing protein [Pseudobdellovibrionaceae bacterium]|nr:fibronectin type III domain-containing protein [Pseudobdellovibrionaceae bacterium]